MAIAMINGESCSAGASLQADLVAARGAEAGREISLLTPAGEAKALALPPRTEAQAGRAREPFYRAMPAANSAVRAEAFAPAAQGYAPAREMTASLATSVGASAAKAKSSSIQKSSSTKTTSKKTTSSSKTSTSRELAFLDDKHLSIEEKLFQFMALMTKKNDQELIDAMKEYDAKKKAASSSSSSSEKSSGSPSEKNPSSSEKSSSSSESKPLLNPDGGGGFFGFIGDALGSIGKAVVGGAETLAKDLGGPALAGVATAVGLPFLAPVALQVGGDLSAGVIEGVASTVGLGTKSASRSTSSAAPSVSESASKTGSSSSNSKSSGSSKTTKTTSNTSSAAGPEEFDEKLEMLKLQRLVDKQSAMFSALTNSMKAMHDMQMTAVQNIR